MNVGNAVNGRSPLSLRAAGEAISVEVRTWPIEHMDGDVRLEHIINQTQAMCRRRHYADHAKRFCWPMRGVTAPGEDPGTRAPAKESRDDGTDQAIQPP